VRGDGDRLAQVATNLVDNAARFARSSVVVTVTSSGSAGVLTVDDDGAGIAPTDLPQVFDRLYVSRHDPERRESGSGLGLAIVKELVDAMGGSVVAASSPAAGARLVVHLPLAIPLPAPTATPS
jgi:signal transduction histidine kinase